LSPATTSLPPQLPGAEVVARALADEIACEASLAEIGAVLLRGVPGKRSIFELELTIDDRGERRQRRMLAKVYVRDQGALACEVLRDLRGRGFARGMYRVPKPLGYDPASRLLLLEWIDGVPLRNAVLEGRLAPGAIERAAEWLAGVHRSGSSAGRPYTFERQLHTLRGWAVRIAEVSTAAQKKLTALLSRIEDRAGAVKGWTAGPTHRDFSPDHVIIKDGVVTGLDFDEFCQYDPLFDVAHFVAHLRCLEPGALAPGRAALGNRFLSAYRALAPDYSEARMALHSAVSYFKLAHITATITRPPDWERRLDVLLDAAGGGEETLCT
jgi:hypothetical protein